MQKYLQALNAYRGQGLSRYECLEQLKKDFPEAQESPDAEKAIEAWSR